MSARCWTTLVDGTSCPERAALIDPEDGSPICHGCFLRTYGRSPDLTDQDPSGWASGEPRHPEDPERRGPVADLTAEDLIR